MARIIKFFVCPVCKRRYDTCNEAMSCKNQHPIIIEDWAEGKGRKRVKVGGDGRTMEQALFEADLPDDIKERAQRLCVLWNIDPEKLIKLGYRI